jgi:hypothetical protein
MADRLLQSLQAVEHCALIRALTVRGVAEWFQLLVVRGKSGPSGLSRLLENGDHEGTHEVARVGLLVFFG